MLEGTPYLTPLDGRGQWVQNDSCVAIWLAGPDDTTAEELFDYNADCFRCWAGYPHSGDYHRQAVTQYERTEGGWARA